MEILLTRSPQGALVPWGEEEAQKLTKIKVGTSVRADVKQIRNARFFRKWWLLAKFAYDIWSDGMPTRFWRGSVVRPQFDKFRKDLIILTGRCHPVFNIHGEMRLEADSLAWSEMTEEIFEQLYSETINVILEKVLSRPDLTPEQVRRYVDTALQFS